MKKRHLKFPNRKISETFLEFSSPLLDAIGQAATRDQVEKVLQITYSVWNSIVLDTEWVPGVGPREVVEMEQIIADFGL